MLLPQRFCYISLLGCSSALLLPSQPVLLPSSNVSIATNVSNTTLLGAWPPNPGWTFNSGPDLTVEVVHYGEYAPQDRWSEIRQSLDDLRQRQETEIPSSYGYLHTWRSGPVHLEVRPDSEAQIASSDLAKILEQIEGFYFGFRDNPRELYTDLKDRTTSRLLAWLDIQWVPWSDGWPASMTLPWRLGGFYDRMFSMPYKVEVFSYARDLESSSLDQVKSALYGIKAQFDKGAPYHYISQRSYTSGFVTLKWEGDDPKAVQIPIRRVWVRMVCDLIAAELDKSDHDPRELGMRVVDPHGKSPAKVFLLIYWDEDEPQSQSSTHHVRSTKYTLSLEHAVLSIRSRRLRSCHVSLPLLGTYVERI